MMIGTLYRCTQQFSIPFITLDGEKDTVTILPGEAVWRLANTGNINGSGQKIVVLELVAKPYYGKPRQEQLILSIDDFKNSFTQEIRRN